MSHDELDDEVEQRLRRRDNGRYQANFRPYADVGGGRESLIPEEERYGTKDRETAKELARERLKELKQKRRKQERSAQTSSSARNHLDSSPTIAYFAYQYLAEKAKTTDVDRKSLDREEDAIENYLDGIRLRVGDPADIQLHEFRPTDAGEARAALLNDYISPRTGDTLSPSSIKQAERAAREMFKYARYYELVPEYFRPVSRVPGSVSAGEGQTDYLETYEVAAFLEALAEPEGLVPPVAYTFALALTGGRRSGVGGLFASDVREDRQQIQFEENRIRGLKTGLAAERAVPLWPQLDVVLRAYQERLPRSGRRLLFPTEGENGNEKMIQDMRKRWKTAQRRAGRLLEQTDELNGQRLWDFRIRGRSVGEEIPREEFGEDVPESLYGALRSKTIGTVLEDEPEPYAKASKRERCVIRNTLRAHLDEKRITPNVFRVTYVSARLQTVDPHGNAVTKEQVREETGHKTSSMIDTVYSRLPNHPQRSELVEFRLPNGSLPGMDAVRNHLTAYEANQAYRNAKRAVTEATPQIGGSNGHAVPFPDPDGDQQKVG